MIRIEYKIGDKIGKCSFLKEIEPLAIPCGQLRRKAIFLCNCGQSFSALIENVKSCNSTRCQKCISENITKRKIRHGFSRKGMKRDEYKIWEGMKDRCNRINHKQYNLYGGRGIKVCKRWEKFENFYADMGDRPSKIHSIERKNNNKGYNKPNCVWATPKEQANNRSTNINIRYNGEIKNLTQWCEELQIPYLIVRQRIVKHKWSIEKAFQTV